MAKNEGTSGLIAFLVIAALVLLLLNMMFDWTK